jgi:hypothetical protein
VCDAFSPYHPEHVKYRLRIPSYSFIEHSAQLSQRRTTYTDNGSSGSIADLISTGDGVLPISRGKRKRNAVPCDSAVIGIAAVVQGILDTGAPLCGAGAAAVPPKKPKNKSHKKKP